jgi:hypothetical protein
MYLIQHKWIQNIKQDKANAVAEGIGSGISEVNF